MNPKNTLAESRIKDTDAATRALGLHLRVMNASSEAEIEDAFLMMTQSRVDALVVSVDPLYGLALGEKIVALATRYNIPVVYDARSYIEPGGLIRYGPILSDSWRQAGVYVSRILKGEKPSDLQLSPLQRTFTTKSTQSGHYPRSAHGWINRIGAELPLSPGLV